MIENLYIAALSNDDEFFCDIDSDIVIFFGNDIHLNSINLNNINLDDDNFDIYNSETINHVRHMNWYNRYKQHKACKKKR